MHNKSNAQETDTSGVAAPAPATIATPFPDSVFKFNVRKPNPKRAGLYSACVPGLGQLYNKQYWKVGLVYVGGAVISGFLISNYRDYTNYRKIYIGMIDNNPATPDTYKNYTAADVKYIRDGLQRYLQYSVLAAAAGYVMNILDAFISAHLKSFDMSKDISLHVLPYYNHQKQTGLTLSFCLN